MMREEEGILSSMQFPCKGRVAGQVVGAQGGGGGGGAIGTRQGCCGGVAAVALFAPLEKKGSGAKDEQPATSNGGRGDQKCPQQASRAKGRRGRRPDERAIVAAVGVDSGIALLWRGEHPITAEEMHGED